VEPLVTPLAVAVIGIGSIGRRYIGLLEGAEDVRVVAVTRRPEVAAELEGRGISVSPTIEEAPICDGAIVTTRTSEHAGDVATLLDRGFGSILVEKPLAADSSTIAGEPFASNSGRIFTAYCFRFNDALKTFRERVLVGGPPHSVEVVCRSWLPDWRPGRDHRETYSASAIDGGVLRDLIHEVDYVSWIFGVPSGLQASVSETRSLGIDSEEQATLMWDAPTGTSVVIGLDYITRPAVRQMSAYRNDGILVWHALEGRVTFRDPAGSEQELFNDPDASDRMYEEQVAAFLRRLRGGSSDGLASFEEGLASLRITEAARRSSMSRKAEMVANG
jgi:predicted dehydrogenase